MSESTLTAYRQVCDYQNVQRCQSVPSCHDTTRPVCNSHGCVNEPTHECTTSQSCTSEPSRNVCENVQVAVNCRLEPYTATRTVEYSCTKTREVPVGTELVEQLTANVTIAFTGDKTGLSGKDAFAVSVANGNDLSRDDLAVESTATGDTHLFRLKKVSEIKKTVGDKKSVITAAFEIDAIPYASVLAHRTKITDLGADRGAIAVTTTGEAIDPSVVLSVVSKKDHVIGGLKKTFEQTFKASDLKVTDVSGGQTASLVLGTCFNARPHEFTLTLTRDLSTLFSDGILNTSTAAKAEKDLTVTFTKRIKMRGKSKDSCSSDDERQQQEQSQR